MARGSVSPFEIVLTAAERGELEKRAATYTDSYAAGGESQDRAPCCCGAGKRGYCGPA